MLLMFCISHFQPDSVLLLKNERKTGIRTAAYYFCKQGQEIRMAKFV